MSPSGCSDKMSCVSLGLAGVVFFASKYNRVQYQHLSVPHSESHLWIYTGSCMLAMRKPRASDQARTTLTTPDRTTTNDGSRDDGMMDDRFPDSERKCLHLEEVNAKRASAAAWRSPLLSLSST